MYTVYIFSCSDQTFHVGITNNYARRESLHFNGDNPDAYTYTRRPLKLVFKEEFSDLLEAKRYTQLIKELPQDEMQPKQFQKLYDSLQPNVVGKVQDASEKAVVLPAVYLGNIAYFSKMIGATRIKLVADERYEKQTFRNRAQILSANGVQDLSIPIIRPKGKQTRMDEAELSTIEPWQKIHLKSIMSAYKKAPFYTYYAEELNQLLQQPHASLFALNCALIQYLVKACKIEVSIEVIHEQTPAIEMLTSQAILPKSTQKMTFAPYQQIFNDRFTFQENMSIIDLLFCTGPQARDILTNTK